MYIKDKYKFCLGGVAEWSSILPVEKIVGSNLFCFVFRFNVSGSGRLSLDELKFMMEKLGSPQTHLGLKAMIQVRHAVAT
jgi:hypothetical protein